MTRVSSREQWLSPTDSIASLEKFYPAKIYVGHHQLRHYISSPEQDLLYYVSQRDVFVIDLANQQCSLIATVPFESRCLAADLGWVCVGGEQNGDCAFIKVEKDEHGRPTCFGHDMTTDLLGGEIVNSMSIHTFLNHGKTPDEPVVLISNNDKSVKIYSLAQRQVLTTLPHPIPMNFAALSPDSTILAAVGDCDRVYFYRRQLDKGSEGDDGSCARYAKYDWKLFASAQIPVGEDHVYDDHSFAVIFSPSGHLCAASAQGGVISVFDMQHLLDDKMEKSSIICSFKSSRPAVEGCVRSMLFSPAPWDLLVWAEHSGRIGIADLRQACVRRQVLDLDRKKPEQVDLEDGTPVAYRNVDHKQKIKHQHLARLRAMRGLSSSRDADSELSLDDLSNESAQRPRNYSVLDLDSRERSVIQALETTMDDVQQPSARPYSINYTSSPRWIGGRVPADSPLHSTISGRPSGSRSHHPRRRSSVVLSESTVNAGRYLDVTDGQRTRLSASPARIGEDDDLPVMSTNDLTPSASRISSQPTPNSIPPSDPWHVIQTALESARETDNSALSNLARIEAALEAERQLGDQLESQLFQERQLAMLLRRQLDTQQRLLAENSSQLDTLRAAARESNARVEASLERVLQRQLAHEQQFLDQRSEQLRTQMHAGIDYTRGLESVRDRLTESINSRLPLASTRPESTSAQTSALATVATSRRPSDVNNILTDHTESRRERLAHIENLQRQVRRAESRVALAAIDIQALENAIRREMGEDILHRRAEDAVEALPLLNSSHTPTTQTTASISAATVTAASPHPSTRQAELINRPSLLSGVQPTTTPATASTTTTAPTRRSHPALFPNPSELGRQRVPDADMRLARMMFLSGGGGSRSLDANGNWLPPSAGLAVSAVRRVGGGSGGVVRIGFGGGEGEGDEGGGTGLGTAGLSFNPGGDTLYAGTVEGIFEFKINIQDRLVFPSMEMR